MIAVILKPMSQSLEEVFEYISDLHCLIWLFGSLSLFQQRVCPVKCGVSSFVS